MEIAVEIEVRSDIRILVKAYDVQLVVARLIVVLCLQEHVSGVLSIVLIAFIDVFRGIGRSEAIFPGNIFQ